MRLILILFVFIIHCIVLQTIQISLLLALSFLLNVSYFLFILNYLILNSKYYFDPFLCICIIFYYTFLILSPLVQLYNNANVFVTGYHINHGLAAYTNLWIFLFYYIFFTVRKLKFVNLSESITDSLSNQFNISKVVMLLFALSIFSLVLSLSYIQSSLSGNSFSDEKFAGLIVAKFLMIIPFICFLKFLSLDKKYFKKNIFYLFIILIIVLITKNPILEKRNSIGPIYFTLLFILFQKKLSNNVTFLTVVFGIFLVFFPLSAIVTNVSFGGHMSFADKIARIQDDSSLKEGILSLLLNHFNSLHYDGWVMCVAVSEYVQLKGVTWGSQLLGAIFFFIPRGLWSTKAYGTGQFISEKLLSIYYGFDFSNLSSPFPCEGYVNFGLFGVFVFSFIFSKLSIFLKKFSKIDRFNLFYYIYISFYLFFFLRGDLQNAIAFLTGSILAFMLVNKLVNTFCSAIYITK